MGIILRDQSTSEILFYMKGADTVMSSIVQYNDWLAEEVDNMARYDYFCLSVCMYVSVSLFLSL